MMIASYRGRVRANVGTDLGRRQLAENPTMELDFAQLSDIGRTREHNEDCLGYVQPRSPAQAQSHGWLFVVADGVGGQKLGELASYAAVENLLENFWKSAGR